MMLSRSQLPEDMTEADTRPSEAVALVEPVISTEHLDVYYGDFLAVRDVNLDFAEHEITALIGPSGCGKSTVLRSLNRMNDLIPGARVDGSVRFHGTDIYVDGVDPVEATATTPTRTSTPRTGRSARATLPRIGAPGYATPGSLSGAVACDLLSQ